MYVVLGTGVPFTVSTNINQNFKNFNTWPNACVGHINWPMVPFGRIPWDLYRGWIFCEMTVAFKNV